MTSRLNAIMLLAGFGEGEAVFLENLKTGTASGFGRPRRISGPLNALMVDTLLGLYYSTTGMSQALAEYCLGILHRTGLGSVLVILKFLVKSTRAC